MGRLDVTIMAADPLSGFGAADILESCPTISLLPDHERTKADIVVMIEEHVGYAAIARLRERYAEQGHSGMRRCVVVTDAFNEDCILAAVDCGVTAVLPLARVTSKMLIMAVLNAGNGLAQLPPRLQGALLTRLVQVRRDVLGPLGMSLSGLSVRERDVLTLVAEGFDTTDIALKLAYSERTVKNVLQGVMTRFGLHNRPHAVAYAVRAGAI